MIRFKFPTKTLGWKLHPPRGKRAEALKKKATILDLLSNRSLLLKSLILFFNWFVNSFCYYGLTLNSYGWGGNIHLGFAINGIMEIPAYGFVSNLHFFRVLVGHYTLSRTPC